MASDQPNLPRSVKKEAESAFANLQAALDEMRRVRHWIANHPDEVGDEDREHVKRIIRAIERAIAE